MIIAHTVDSLQLVNLTEATLSESKLETVAAV